MEEMYFMREKFYKRKEEPMKKKVLAAIIAAMTVLAGCGGEGEESSSPIINDLTPIDLSTATPAPELSEGDTESESEAGQEPEQEENREGMYRSELTNEWIDEELQNQRPIAVMVDNEKIALPHYGLTEADVVYELMNSTLNDRITRFMVLVKDWAKIEQLGSIRSVRSTNVYLVGEWNAVLCHDGGPFFAMDLIKEKNYCENFTGTFSRVTNGKPKEYTEYIMSGDLEKNFSSKGYSVEYNEHYPGPHYQFSNTELDLSNESGVINCNEIRLLPFRHNKSTLKYNAESGTYDYYEYGEPHLDPQHDNAQLTFKNLLIQSCSFVDLGEGYMVYDVIDAAGNDGYYITNGKAIEVTWYKPSDTSPTVYYNKQTGEEIQLNTGKTYIAIVPSDTWDDIVIE